MFLQDITDTNGGMAISFSGLPPETPFDYDLLSTGFKSIAGNTAYVYNQVQHCPTSPITDPDRTSPQSVFWYSQGYGNAPLYGYTSLPDVYSDAIFSPPGTWPFPGFTYLKAVDSYAVIGFEQTNGNDVIYIATSDTTGDTIKSSINTQKTVSNGGRTLLDVGMAYGVKYTQ